MSDIQPAPTKMPSNAETLLHRAEDEAAKDPFDGVNFGELELSLYRPRTMFSSYWLVTNGRVDLMQPTASLAVLIYKFSGMPFKNQVELARAAAFILAVLVLITNLIGQSFSRQQVNQ